MIIFRLSVLICALILTACGETASSNEGDSDSDNRAMDNPVNSPDSAAEAKIAEALDWLEGRGPRLATAIASGFNVVRSVLLDHPQVKVLTSHPKEAVTGILLRRAKLGDKAGPFARIGWYLVLEESKDPRGVTVLLEDLAAFKDDGASYLHAPGYPFRYGIDALRALRPDVTLDGSIEALFRERSLIADRY